ncbi:YacL family protein [Vibrio diabolicus]|uniref:YacL family protein n=1 Tax=Vibrio TaxID=662 RepID=UPI00062C037F|nr:MULTISPECIES: YacL family protein [Vibrio]MCR9495047.1 YacL family protein [Vibrio alginolyticus]MCR9476120.1 YacL family protein [Vibrio antiquarius]MCR9564995.1 YacL family protein [Vibrio alginolyticus]MCS0338678.1 YacL family protein [Vibrio diabolicus]MCS0353788.1 YacL family protein [Vibrio diabolicus]
MEFEFIRNTLMGEYYVKCSMGHEIVGRWLQEEIGKDPMKIAQVEKLIEQSFSAPSQEHNLTGTEISLMIQGDEVLVQENALAHDHDVEMESELDFYNAESTASCGIEDFMILIERWKDFLNI